MDLIGALDPQLVIPVVFTVACAFLVYFFGFQKTQEPSFQHLAVLQSAGKSSKQAQQAKQKSAVTSTGNSKPKEKVVANGHAHPVPKEKSVKVDKENVKPQQTPKLKKEKKIVEKEDDVDGGDWTAVSRKDKKEKKMKETSGKPKKEEIKRDVDDDEMLSIEEVMKIALKAAKGDKAQSKVLKEVIETTKVVVEEEKEEEVVVEKVVEPPAVVLKEKPVAPPPVAAAPKKAKEPKTKASPVKVVVVEEPKLVEEEKVIEIIKTDSPAKNNKTKDKDTVENNNNNNVAFDEMGDLWEEAKSRGNKKKARARRD